MIDTTQGCDLLPELRQAQCRERIVRQESGLVFASIGEVHVQQRNCNALCAD